MYDVHAPPFSIVVVSPTTLFLFNSAVVANGVIVGEDVSPMIVPSA